MAVWPDTKKTTRYLVQKNHALFSEVSFTGNAPTESSHGIPDVLIFNQGQAAKLDNYEYCWHTNPQSTAWHITYDDMGANIFSPRKSARPAAAPARLRYAGHNPKLRLGLAWQLLPLLEEEEQVGPESRTSTECRGRVTITM